MGLVLEQQGKPGTEEFGGSHQRVLVSQQMVSFAAVGTLAPMEQNSPCWSTFHTHTHETRGDPAGQCEKKLVE